MSKLASTIGALAAALLGAWSVSANLPTPVKTITVGVITTVAAALFPALKAQLDAAGGQLAGVVGVLVAALVDVGIVHWHVSTPVQAALVAVITAAAGLFVPAVHLQQATLHKPQNLAETRKVA
jgi:hypothetical protein